MGTPYVFLAYAPRGSGLRCAIAYLTAGSDVYGWFAGPRDDTTVVSRYFLLEGLYTPNAAGYDTVEPEDLHGDWTLDEARRHELASMQEAFAHEWLFYRDDERATSELQAYAEAELAAGELNVRFAKLEKFSRLQPNWTYYSPGFERTVLRHLAKRWPLEYRPHADEVAEKQKQRAASRARP